MIINGCIMAWTIVIVVIYNYAGVGGKFIMSWVFIVVSGNLPYYVDLTLHYKNRSN